MECFGIFWAARPENDTKFKIDPWLEECYKTRQDLVVDDLYFNETDDGFKDNGTLTAEDKMTNEQLDLRDIIKKKAEKHSRYYRSLYTRGNIAESGAQMAPRTAPNRTPLNLIQTTLQQAAQAKELEQVNTYNDKSRQRRVGVYRINEDSEAVETRFKSVKALREKYQKMIEGTAEDAKEEKTIVRKDTYLIPPVSGYCSSSASAGSDDEKDRSWYATKKGHLEVRRSGSSDSAVGLTQSDEESSNANVEVADINSRWIEAYEKNGPTSYSPYSPRGSIDHINVPTKTLIEAQYFPLPANRKFSDCPSDVECGEKNDSRRQSCFTDDGDEQSRYRFWRTPSVVVSDYSDDVVGLTLDDIEYFRNQRKENSSPDSSLHSSCSNLNYCGSTISSLDSEYILRKPFRKGSECSSCSTFSGDEGDSDDRQQPQATIDKPSGWRKLRNIVQWTPFFQTYKKQRYPWVQLAGHQGNFKAGPDQGTILKKLCSKEEKCFNVLMKDVLRPYVPEFKGLIGNDDGDCEYLQLQDLLSDFVSPCVMDCKIGVRTYLEEELAKAKEKPKLRKDMYEKMCQIDKNAPTDEEHRLKGVTKPRYMVWRETISSTATLGFRIEGIRRSDGTSSKDFKTTKSKEQIIKAFRDFTDGFPHAIPKYIQRLKAIKATLESSTFFSTHEMIGSSLLFVHDRFNANIWLIDFAKTVGLPENTAINHSSKWIVGNHEDGYLIGLNNLISIFVTMLEQQPVAVTPPPLITQDAAEDSANDAEELRS